MASFQLPKPGSPTSLADIKELLKQSINARESHAAAAAHAARDIKALRERHEHQVAMAPAPVRAATAKALTVEFNRERAVILANTDPARLEPLRAIKAARDNAMSAKSFLGSPRSLLTTAGIGTQERANMLAEVEKLAHQPAALRTLASKAAATKNVVLAAVIQTVVDGMAPDKRPIDVGELADIVAGQEARGIAGMIDEIDLAWQAAWMGEKELSTGHSSPRAKIDLGLAQRRAGPVDEEVRTDDFESVDDL